MSGTIREDAELVALPGGRGVKVRGLQVHGRRESSATAGRRVAVNLGGVDVEELSRGDTLTEADAFEPSRRLDVVMELLADARPLRHGARVRFHSGTTELLGRVALAGGAADAASVSSAGPFGETTPVYARIRLESQAVVTRGDRFILRAYSPVVTIGGGVVLDPQPARGSIRRDAALDRFRRLDPVHSSDDDAICAFIEDKAGAGVTRLALRARSGLPGPAVEQAVARLATAGKATVLGDLIVSPSVLEALAERLVRELASHHATSALSEGMPREEARDRIFRRAHPAVFERVLETLSAAKRIAGRDRLALAGHQVSLTPQESAAQAAIERVYRDAKLTPPDLGAAAQETGASRAIVDRVVGLLVRNRTLVKVESMLFHASALEELKENIRALKSEAGTARVDVASFKARYGVTRKYAIPLLEYLDRERVTRRQGETRVVL